MYCTMTISIVGRTPASLAAAQLPTAMMMTLLLLLVSSAAVCCATDPDPSWTRAEKLVGQMTLACAVPPSSQFLRRPAQRAICPASAPLIPAGSTGTRSEKVQLLQGTAKAAGPDPEVPRPYVGRVPGIERLKIPDLNMNDGPYARHTFLLCPVSSVDLSAALAACRVAGQRVLTCSGFAGRASVAAGRSARRARPRSSHLASLSRTPGTQPSSASGEPPWEQSEPPLQYCTAAALTPTPCCIRPPYTPIDLQL
jgi:hypothetical protein